MESFLTVVSDLDLEHSHRSSDLLHAVENKDDLKKILALSLNKSIGNIWISGVVDTTNR